MADSEQSEKTQKSSIRHDWYQTETHIIVNILHRNVKPTDLKVDFQDQSLNVSFPTESGDDYNLNLVLSYEVVPSECSYKASPSKVEIKLKKKEGFRWVKLEGDTFSRLALKNASYGEHSSVSGSPQKPPKNWDKVVDSITNSEEYKAVDEGAINELFQKIYSEGSDDVRKAMMKSFLESNGTVLSTNWDEVKADKVDCKPPDGVEWKKWD
ncbi:UNVERIFIED_CONTAM: hypothetical protein PYX00_002240 [Menopon gallinae]|uniref:Suppressor of G2 allele of SKP1 n=1 Tax=Menopon gallinae TaxID=328185 RepID=A0AAW2IHN5_9NEOP